MLSAIYLIYIAAFLPESQAEASAGPVMAVTVSGESVLAIDAVRINYLQAYNARYLDFPAVLTGSRWVSVFDDQTACSQNPKKVWSFTENEDEGHSCKLQSQGSIRTYACQIDKMFLGTSNKLYNVEFGDKFLPDWALERPHITLKQEGRPEKTIGLQLCESSSF